MIQKGFAATNKDGYLDKKEIIAYSKKDLTWEGLEFVVWDGFFFSCCYSQLWLLREEFKFPLAEKEVTKLLKAGS